MSIVIAGFAMRERAGRDLIARIVSEQKPDTVGDLAALVKAENAFDEAMFLETVKDMVKDGSLKLQAECFIHTFPDYLFTPSVSSWFWLTLGGVAVAVVLALVPGSLFPLSVLRWFFGSVFLIFLPGYACLQLLFPMKQDLRASQRYILSIPVSLALLILIGLMLNYSGVGIRLFTLLESMGAITVIFATAAALRLTLLIKV